MTEFDESADISDGTGRVGAGRAGIDSIHFPARVGEFDNDRIVAAVREILIGIGEDPDRDGLRDTPERVARGALLDPAIDLLPHVGLDFAEDAGLDESFETVDEAIDRRLATGAPTPREALQEEMRERHAARAAEHLAAVSS